jgi:hypothetical protein
MHNKKIYDENSSCAATIQCARKHFSYCAAAYPRSLEGTLFIMVVIKTVTGYAPSSQRAWQPSTFLLVGASRPPSVLPWNKTHLGHVRSYQSCEKKPRNIYNYFDPLCIDSTKTAITDNFVVECEIFQLSDVRWWIFLLRDKSLCYIQ